MAWAIRSGMPGGEGKLPCGHAREAEEGRCVLRHHAEEVEGASESRILRDGGSG